MQFNRDKTETRKIAKNDVRPCVCRFFCVTLQPKNAINRAH